jgi:hypothetical protein
MDRESRVETLINKYSLNNAASKGRSINKDLKVRWLDSSESYDYSSTTIADLADYFNQKILRQVYRDHGRKYESRYIESQYDTLTSELEHSADPDFLVDKEGSALIVELKEDGIDVEELSRDFVSYLEIHTYLTETLNITPNSKVRRLVDEYGLNKAVSEDKPVDEILIERWTDDEEYPRTTISSLRDWFNQMLLEKFYESHDQDYYSRNIREDYQIITDESHPEHTELLNILEESNADISTIREDFIEDIDIHQHLTVYLGLSDCCKVGRIIHKHNLNDTLLDQQSINEELEVRWLGENGYPEIGTRELSRWINQKIIRQVYTENGREAVSLDIESDYEALSDEDHSNHEQLVNKLDASGIDVNELLEDLIPTATLYRHLTGCLDLDKNSTADASNSDTWKNQVDFALDTVEENVGKALRSLESNGELPNATDADFSAQIILNCPECTTQVPLQRAVKRGYVCEDHMSESGSEETDANGSAV